jgi:hypothetical protein
MDRVPDGVLYPLPPPPLPLPLVTFQGTDYERTQRSTEAKCAQPGPGTSTCKVSGRFSLAGYTCTVLYLDTP